MSNLKLGILATTIFCLVLTVLTVYLLGGLDSAQLQAWLYWAGLWAPAVYVVLYTLATTLLLPSTALNLAGGAIFGPWLGTLWTGFGAVVAAVVTFVFARTIGREFIANKTAGRWKTMDAEIRRGGIAYIFAIRLFPVIPYGLVNCAAGLTSISFKDYILGTIPGTLLGVFPFVFLGSSGLKALRTGDILPLVGALVLTGILVAGATWYSYRLRYSYRLSRSRKDLQKLKKHK